jgi:D-alanyl-lipoteichoic acid acyltransferase DltB (MBOAT superfamily)
LDLLLLNFNSAPGIFLHQTSGSVGWNFAAYGAAHALGVVVNHYYTIGLKKRLGREGFKAYNANPWIRAVAVALTFCYCAASLILFANTFPEMKGIFLMLR